MEAVAVVQGGASKKLSIVVKLEVQVNANLGGEPKFGGLDECDLKNLILRTQNMDDIIWQARDLRWYFQSLRHTLSILNSMLS